LIAKHTGWSYDFINRRLPLAFGLQIILLHDLREGLTRVWSAPMREDGPQSGRVDIRSQITKALAAAHEDHSTR